MEPFELMDSSLMDADKMQVFASFCTNSGASDKMNELAKIQEELTSRREGAPDTAGGSSTVAPRITINGRNAQEAVLEGMRRLDKEFRDREALVAKAAEDAKRIIEQGMGKLNRLSIKALKILSSVEDRHLGRKVLFEQREQAAVAREQALATREEELAGRLGALDAREQRLKEEVAQQLAVDHRKELDAKELAYQKICQELQETQKSLRLVLEQAGAAKQ